MKKNCFVLLILLLALLPALPVLGDEARLVSFDTYAVQDLKTGLIWQLDKSRKPFASAHEAEEHAQGLRLGGFADWRLPTLAERWDLLQPFMYKTNGSITFPKFDSKYWTSDTDKGTQPIKLDISCMCRGDQEIEYRDKGYVRAVRGPVANNHP